MGKDVRVEVNLRYHGRKDFTLVRLVSRRDGFRFEMNAQRAIRPYLKEARTSLAKKLGYDPQVYGGSVDRFVREESFTYEVTDARNGRLIAEKKNARRR